jgi:hypothetical protein
MSSSFPDSDSGLVMSENRFLAARDALGYGKLSALQRMIGRGA